MLVLVLDGCWCDEGVGVSVGVGWCWCDDVGVGVGVGKVYRTRNTHEHTYHTRKHNNIQSQNNIKQMFFESFVRRKT